MPKEPQRTIEVAIVDGGHGPITATELLKMNDSEWGYLRDRITEKRCGDRGLTALCLACGFPVYIKPAPFSTLPQFAHYKGAPKSCPWYTGDPKSPERVRANQYQGQQESVAHKMMCNLLAEIVQLDKRRIAHEIEKYLPPKANNYGRYPDLYVEWEDIGSLVIEFQMSNTFQTEISQRHIHYKNEGIPLLWILSNIDSKKQIPQNFLDIIRQHRGNAFVLDQAAYQASLKAETLVLSCFMVENGNITDHQLVTIDELTFPPTKLPYYKDCITPKILNEAEQRRSTWIKALTERKNLDISDEQIKNAATQLPNPIDNDYLRLIAASLTIHSASMEKFFNFLTKQDNLSLMLNSFLDNRDTKKFANIVHRLLHATTAKTLAKESVWKHINKANNEAQQLQFEGNTKENLTFLFPEIFDTLVHEILKYHDALPKWASQT